MPAFKSAYLIHGDDHGRIGERRSRLRAMAEAESGASAVELLEGDACRPEAVAAALSAMTFALGRRFVIADGVERWKDAEVAPVAAAMRGLEEAQITAAFFAREEGRHTAPDALHSAVAAAGGVVAVERNVKARELPRWLQARAKECDLTLELPAAKALIAQVGDRQQRLAREVEKLAVGLGPGATAGVEEVEAACASSAERKAWTLADALVAGDVRTATRALLELRDQGERVGGLLYGIVRRLRDAVQIAEALEAGRPASEIKRGLRMPPFAADRLIADVRERDVDSYRRAIERFADLELDSRGGGDGGSGEDTLAVRAVLAVAG